MVPKSRKVEKSKKNPLGDSKACRLEDGKRNYFFFFAHDALVEPSLFYSSPGNAKLKRGNGRKAPVKKKVAMRQGRREGTDCRMVSSFLESSLPTRSLLAGC
jgi:hypothetical protein